MRLSLYLHLFTKAETQLQVHNTAEMYVYLYYLEGPNM